MNPKIFKKLRESYSKINVHQIANKDYNDKVILVDGTNMFLRCFSAIPTQNSNGDHVGGLVGFMKSLNSLIIHNNPSRVVVVFDGYGGSKRRRDIYSEYKNNRKSRSPLNRNAGFESVFDEKESQKQQMSRLIDYLLEFPIDLIILDYVEADDVIAYMARTYFNKEVIVCSSDKDFLQLIGSDHINVLSLTKKKLYTNQDILDEYGVSAKNFIHYKSIIGDKSDNIDGVKGVGPKTIQKHLGILREDRYLEFDEIYEYIEKSDDNIVKKIIHQKDTFERNYKLMQMDDVNISAKNKSTIRNILDEKISRLNKFKLTRMFSTDGIHNLVDIDKLTKTFLRLDSIARKHYE